MHCYTLQSPLSLSQWLLVQPLKVGMTTKLTTGNRTMRSRVNVIPSTTNGNGYEILNTNPQNVRLIGHS